ncbi:unnamed protein product [Phyllotreta striolata]|uniref:Folylpolyglutamate synthase n=1 Tax=Phyllotreta striolata TaxID=444603 RepID=A0A9N9XPU9_PHYSR|nr:unnamed protein product [Phyllotreta striolata]
MKPLKYKIITSFQTNFSYATKAMENNMHAKTYEGAIDALNEVQSNTEYIRNYLIRPKHETNLPTVAKYLKRSGLELKDLDKLSVIHVTGTNGKGTTCAYTERILRSHGYSTGFFSSPHLLNVRERIRLNGKPVSKPEFAKYFWKIYDTLDSQKENPSDMPLYFRFLTLMALHMFLDKKVDVAILEVGIGGEYDCTNIVRKTEVVGITPLDLDHVSMLGDTLESIAWNKSGIMKEGCSAFTTNQPPEVLNVFKERSKEKKCTLKVIDNNNYSKNCSNIPFHVKKTNASLAFSLAEAYINRDKNGNKTFDPELAIKSIEETHWPGRYEIIRNENLTYYLDGAHTLDSLRICKNWYISHTRNSDRKKCLVFNMTGTRDLNEFFNELNHIRFDLVVFIPNVSGVSDKADTANFKFPEEKQLLKCHEYKTKWLEMYGSDSSSSPCVHVFPSFSQAANFFKQSGDCDVLVTGSIHLIGAALSILDPTLNGTLLD